MDEDNKKAFVGKYLGLFCATLIGAFLAVYVVADMALNRLFNPFIAMNKMDKEFRKMERTMMKELPPNPHGFNGFMGREMHSSSVVNVLYTPEEYKFIIDLRPFDNNSNNIQVTAKDSMINISGEKVVDKKNSHSLSSFSQSYSLDADANIDKMSKKKVKDKYIVTIPLEDKE